MKRWKQKVSIIFLTMLFAFGNNLSTYAEELGDASNIIASGECGENLTWTLDKNGILKITGSGMMEDYVLDGISPWYDYREDIISVEFPEEGLTSIGAHAFNGCSNLKSIEIPKGVELIMLAAFFECTSLETVEIPEGGVELATGVFQGCTNLKSAVLAGDITGMSVNIFADCPNLKYVTIKGNALKTYDMTIISEGMDPWFLVPEGATGYDAYPWNEYNIIYGSSIHMNNLTVQEVGDVKYSGEAVNADIVIMDGSYRLEEGVDYTVEYANNIDIGTADVTVTGQGWYSGTQIINFNIVETLPEKSDTTGSASGVTVLTGEIAYTTAYTLTIPASIDNMDLSQDAETDLGVVSVTKQNDNADFDPTKKVIVTIEYSGELENIEDSDKKVIYTLQQSKGEELVDITSGDKLNFLASDIELGSAFYNLKAIITETNKSGGTYSGTINFLAMVENMK